MLSRTLLGLPGPEDGNSRSPIGKYLPVNMGYLRTLNVTLQTLSSLSGNDVVSKLLWCVFINTVALMASGLPGSKPVGASQVELAVGGRVSVLMAFTLGSCLFFILKFCVWSYTWKDLSSRKGNTCLIDRSYHSGAAPVQICARCYTVVNKFGLTFRRLMSTIVVVLHR